MNDLDRISGGPRWQARPQPGRTVDQPPGLRILDAETGSPLTLKESTVYGTEQPVHSRAGPY